MNTGRNPRKRSGGNDIGDVELPGYTSDSDLWRKDAGNYKVGTGDSESPESESPEDQSGDEDMGNSAYRGIRAVFVMPSQRDACYVRGNSKS